MKESLEHAQERQRKFEERVWQEQNRVPDVSHYLMDTYNSSPLGSSHIQLKYILPSRPPVFTLYVQHTLY